MFSDIESREQLIEINVNWSNYSA